MQVPTDARSCCIFCELFGVCCAEFAGLPGEDVCQLPVNCGLTAIEPSFTSLISIPQSLIPFPA